jgi:hypothetical protein
MIKTNIKNITKVIPFEILILKLKLKSSVQSDIKKYEKDYILP